MIEPIMLKGLRINGQPFFAPSRRLQLRTTACPAVLKLSWSVWHTKSPQHVRWLLRRLQVWITAEQPWWWTSTNADPSRTPVRFRAWLRGPIGYEAAESGSLSCVVFLHLHLAPDAAATASLPVFCPSSCMHTASRDGEVHRPIGGKNSPQG
jgi:hypothetical protein